MSRFRTITHVTTCPACGSAEVIVDDADTGTGRTEIAFVCLDCDTIWPLTCTTEQAISVGGES